LVRTNTSYIKSVGQSVNRQWFTSN
jgi:hypothetical protein